MSIVLGTLEIQNNIYGARYVVLVATNTDLDNVGNGTWTYSGVNQTLTAGAVGTTTIDTVVLADNDRVLVKNQATPLQNGIYVASDTGAGVATVLTRADDLQNGESANSRLVWVQSGSASVALTAWVCTSALGSDVVNADDLTFVQYDVVQTLSIARGGTNNTTYTSGQVVSYNGTSIVSSGVVAANIITSAAKGTDNHIVRWDGTGTPTIQNSTNAQIDDSDNMSGIGNIGMSGDILDANGHELINFQTTAAAVNEITIKNNSTGLEAILGVTGEANMGMTIIDSNANEMLLLDSVASAINQITITNAITGTYPIISGTGDDTDVGITFQSKGAAPFVFTASSATAVGEIRLEDNTGGQYVGIDVPATVTSSWTMTLPAAVGATGQVLSAADNNGNLQWSNISANSKEYTLLNLQANATGTSYNTVGYFPWVDTLYSGFTTRTVYFWAVTTSRALDVQIYGTSQLGTVNVPTSTSGIFSFTFTAPGADLLLQLRIKKASGGGGNPSVYGASLELTS